MKKLLYLIPLLFSLMAGAQVRRCSTCAGGGPSTQINTIVDPQDTTTTIPLNLNWHGASTCINCGFGTAAAASAIVDIRSTSKGLSIPKMTTAQRTAITGLVEGILVWDTDLHKLYGYDGTVWVAAW